jgi:hypothetical protein
VGGLAIVLLSAAAKYDKLRSPSHSDSRCGACVPGAARRGPFIVAVSVCARTGFATGVPMSLTGLLPAPGLSPEGIWAQIYFGFCPLCRRRHKVNYAEPRLAYLQCPNVQLK